jgi:RNA polymerase sigma factor (sigma-70 family)
MSPQVIYLENESWLRTVVRSRVPEPEAVEDIMQNIALALVRQKDTLAEINRLGSWLYQVAVRQVLMYRRTRGRRRRFEEGLVKRATTGAVDAVYTAAGPVDRVLAAEQQQSVRAAMDRLNELDRQILLLKYSENWTYQELSEHLGVGEDTVEYRLSKARKRLWVLLSKSVASN